MPLLPSYKLGLGVLYKHDYVLLLRYFVTSNILLSVTTTLAFGNPSATLKILYLALHLYCTQCGGMPSLSDV